MNRTRGTAYAPSVPRSPRLSGVSRPLLLGFAALVATGCGASDGSAPAADALLTPDATADAVSAATDAGTMDFAVYGDTGAQPDAPVVTADAGLGEPCDTDQACVAPRLCTAGTCAEPPPAPPPTPVDGVTRAGASRFDLAPPSFETWTDRASAECPENRPGQYDGPLTTRQPFERCDDTFEDANGNGVFDALWLGGGAPDRPARAVDVENPPEGQVVVLRRDDRVWVLLSLDVHAIGPAQLRQLVVGIAARTGLPERALAVHATGGRSGPDAVGLSGPTLAGPGARENPALVELVRQGGVLFERLPVRSGASPAWWQTVTERAASAVNAASRSAVPATLQFATVEVAAREAPPEVPTTQAALRAAIEAPTLLSQDERWPLQRDREVRGLLLASAADGAILAALGAWGGLPAGTARGGAPDLSADFPGYARRLLETRFPGAVGLWLTYASSEEVSAGARAFVPETDADGLPVDAEGRPLLRGRGLETAAPAEVRPAALGRLLGGLVARALAEAPAPVPVVLEVRSRDVWLPLRNPRWALAAHLGVVAGLGAWLTGANDQPDWSGAAMAPACGGLGCLRSRLDHVGLGPMTLLTVPGGLDEAYVHGREGALMRLEDGRSANWLDLDLDGLLDADDPELRYAPRDASEQSEASLAAPVNPQRFEAIDGLATPETWLLGRTNGGSGTARPRTEFVNPFEGALPPDAVRPSGRMGGARAEAGDENAEDPNAAPASLCDLGFDCADPWTLETLSRTVYGELPALLADLPGGHLLALAPPAGPADARPPPPGPGAPWRIVGPDGTVRGEGEGLRQVDADLAFALDTDFFALGVQPGDTLERPGSPEPPIAVLEVVPVTLGAHPNVGDVWRATHPDSGDLVYNAACELLFAGGCPSPRPMPVELDPCQALPCNVY